MTLLGEVGISLSTSGAQQEAGTSFLFYLRLDVTKSDFPDFEFVITAVKTWLKFIFASLIRQTHEKRWSKLL